MNFLLAFPLLFAILFSGHRYITAMEENSTSCYKKCPPGFHKTDPCSVQSDGEKAFKCKKCDKETYTDIENTSDECIRCGWCVHYQVEIKPCTFNSNVVCDCMEEYYNANSRFSSTRKDCRPCTSKPTSINNSDYTRKCQICQSPGCLNDPECQRKCTTATSTSTTILANIMNKTAAATRNTPSNSTTTNPLVNPVPSTDNNIFWLVWVAAIFAVIFWLLLFKNLFEKPDVKQCTEDPKINEQRSHQGSASDTLTLNISEETPMMNHSQSPEHQANNSTLLPNTEHRAARQDEQSKDWPAIVLYAIIKEVPLRRWKEFLRLLSVADEELERAELDAGLGLGSMERQYQMLRIWSQRSSASLNDVFSALHYMDLARCAQLLQDNLENLQWRAESKQDPTA